MRWLLVLTPLFVAAARLEAPPAPEPDPFANGRGIELHRVIPANERGKRKDTGAWPVSCRRSRSSRAAR